MKNSDSSWWSLAFGCIATVSSLCGLLFIDDGFMWRGVFIPIWTDWLVLLLGIIITVLSILSIRRGETKPKPYTDEEIAQAEADLDAMYLRETGELPKKPEKEQ